MTSSPLAMAAMRNLKDNRSPRRYPRKSMAQCTALEPNIEVDIDGLLSQIHSINGAITATCLSEDGYFSQDEDMDPAMSRSAERKLTEPLENLAMAFEIILGRVKNWADRARFFEQNTVVKAKQTPAAKGGPLTSSNIDAEEQAVDYVMKLLKESGPIDRPYLQIFDHFIEETRRPLAPMFHLIAFLESIADTANGRPCSIARERAAEEKPQPSPEKSEHAESTKENDSPSHCPEHGSESDHEMADAASGAPPTDTVPSPSLLLTPPLTSKATTFPQSEPPPSPTQPRPNTIPIPSSPSPSLTDPQSQSPPFPSQPRPNTILTDPPPTTPFYITRLTSRGHPPTTLAHPSATDGPIWTRILTSARIALFAAEHLASHAESAKDHARSQQKVWRRMMAYFDERAGLIRRFRAEGGFRATVERAPEPTVPLTAEEREEHEAAEAVRRVEEMIRRESGGGGGGDEEEEDEGEGEGEMEMRERYRQGMQKFEREERWRRSPSIRWTDREEDVSERLRGSADENINHNNRGRRRRYEDKGKAETSAGFGFGPAFGIETNSMLSSMGLGSAFADMDMIGGGPHHQPALTTRSPLEVKGKGKMKPGDWDDRPGKGMLGRDHALGEAVAPGSEDEKTRDALLGLMRGTKRKGG